MSDYKVFRTNNLWNLAERDNPTTATDLKVVSASEDLVLVEIPRYGASTAKLTGSFSFNGSSPEFSDIQGLVYTRKVYINGVMHEERSYSGGADIQSIFGHSLGLTLLSGDDLFEGSPDFDRDDGVQGLSGNDRFKGNGDVHGDYFFGGDGVDTAVYRGKFSEYVIAADNAIQDSRLGSEVKVSGLSVVDSVIDRDGKDYLNEVERFQFSDKSLAFDVGALENAGKAKLFTGAIAHSMIHDSATLGTFLYFIDNGYAELTALSQLAIDAGLISTLAGGSSNEALVSLVTKNLLGQANFIVEAMLLTYLNGTVASYSQAQFLGAVAALEVNQQRVDLVGLAETGMEYIPLGL